MSLVAACALLVFDPASAESSTRKVVAVASTGPNTVQIDFNRRLGPSVGLQHAFKIKGLDIDHVVPAPGGRSLLVFTSTQEQMPYLLVIRRRGRFATLGKRAFRFTGTALQEDVAPDQSPPAVVSAASTSTHTVVVTFSEPMGDSAVLAANYAIQQDAPLPDAGTLQTIRATFVDDTRTTVELLTLCQSDMLYVLTVSGARDTSGLPVGGFAGDPSGTSATRTAGFRGTPPSASDRADLDGDGVEDHAELLGWLVVVRRAGGATQQHWVTSDPMIADTDADGLRDDAERLFAVDPRTGDTDGDGLGDANEALTVHSDPASQDTDGDGIADEFEVSVLGTSPLLDDTDGDQLRDAYEMVASNRDPRLADLPRPQVKIGNVSLALDVRFDFTDTTGTSASEERNVATTLTRGEDETFRTSNEVSNKATIETSTELTAKAEFPEGGGVEAKVSASAGLERGTTSTFGNESTTRSEEAYHDSLTQTRARDHSQSTTRRVDDASMKVDLSIENTSDIPFTIRNLELTAQAQDPRDRRRLVPVASLVPENPQFEGINVGAIGDLERGPFVFAAVDVFPQKIEDLMKSPRGLVVKLANFDILDESGRNFVFTSRDIVDRTAGIDVDYGDGRADTWRVAVNSAFDGRGRPLGITMRHALRDVIGLDYAVTSVLRDTDGDFATPPRPVEILTRVRDVATGFADRDPADGLDERKGFWVVFSAQPLDPATSFDDLVLRAGQQYNLTFVQDLDRDGVWAREEYVHGSSDLNPNSDGDGLGDAEEIQQGWVVQLRGGRDAQRVYPDPVQADSDRDQLPDQNERDCGLDPRQRDTDLDGLTDWEELFGQQVVDGVAFPMVIRDPSTGVVVATVPQYAGSAILDGGNGLAETVAAASDLQAAPAGGAVRPGGVVVLGGDDRLLDTAPLGDEFVAAGHEVFDRSTSTQVVPDCIAALGIPGFATDPLRADTDGDHIADGDELRLGIDPNDPRDGALFLDDDGDGVPNLTELQGIAVTVNGASRRVFSSPNNPDSDGDGLGDLLEHYIGSDPQAIDTDGDGIGDFNEYAGAGESCVTVVAGEACVRFKDRLVGGYRSFLADCADADTCVNDETPLAGHPGTNASEADSDLDGVQDPVELDSLTITVNGANVVVDAPSSDPLARNSDADGWDDGIERQRGTDPNDADTDDDGTSDDVEAVRGRDPRERDRRISLRYDRMEIVGDCDDFLTYEGEFKWQLAYQDPWDVANGWGPWVPGDWDGDDEEHPIDGSATVNLTQPAVVFVARFGEQFRLKGWIQELDPGGADGTFTWDEYYTVNATLGSSVEVFTTTSSPCDDATWSIEASINVD